MNNKEVMQKYPHRFSNLRGGSRNWGIECKDGWAELIDKMCQELELLDPNQRITFFSIKEKFGLMVTYANQPTPTYEGVYKLFKKYETASAVICEDCGAPGKKRNRNGYLYTSCDKHFK